MPAAARTAPLDELELRAWRGMLEVHAAVIHRLDAEMRAQHGLPLSSYEVLMLLADADGQRMRMADIAAGALVSRSGLTRLIDRLVDLGLVERSSCPEDGRGTFAQLTDTGRGKIEAAGRTHLEGVRRLFLDRLSGGDRHALADAWDRIRSDDPGAAALSGSRAC
jgi:DNA-binding MarR family transcriptional regulator